MTTATPFHELKQRLLAIGWRMDDGPPPFDKMFIHAPWGGLPYRLRDITDEDLARWESGERDEPVEDEEETEEDVLFQLFSAVSASFDLTLLNSEEEKEKFKDILCDGVDWYYYHLNKFTQPPKE
jgi:hypothetical protein